jgi:glycosyltransferase involved in cell wall biosynthesis
VSNFIRSQLIQKGCPPEKIQVNYIGIDLDKFTSNTEVKREPIVLFVGRLIEKKGCEYLIRAMAEVQSRMPDVELVIIGDGVLRDSLEDLASRLLNRYRFLGVQPSEMVKNWMQKASVLAAPSLTTSQGESEGLPMTILEAMAMKLPVVSSKHAGIPEAIIHEQNGLLIAEKDTHALTKYLLDILENPLLQKQFAEEVRRAVEQKFDQKKNIRELERIYGQLALS